MAVKIIDVYTIKFHFAGKISNIKVPEGESMENEKKAKKEIDQSAKIVLVLAFFAMVVVGGLLAVDMNINSILARPEKVSILVVDRLYDGIYKVKLMGTEKDVNVGAYQREVKKTSRLILAGLSSVKDSISGLLNQAKRCSTIIGE